jgi:HEAT repeat protein
LALVGGKDEVGALKEALRELGVREMARWALDRIDCAEATEALIDAAGDVGPEFRVGVVGALSHKTGGGVLKALKKLTTDSDGIVRIAAGEALGNYGDAAADEPIATLCKRASGRARQRLVRARLRLAENLVRGGDQSAGKRIYQAILADNPPPAQQRAAQAALDHLA